MKNGYLFYAHNIGAIFTHHHFKGWGRKKTGGFASWCHKRFGGTCTLMEDGFLGISFSQDNYSFSKIEDEVGIYYDATKPSKLEEILSDYDFASDEGLMNIAEEAKTLIKQYCISKYNDAAKIDEDFLKKYSMGTNIQATHSVLIVAQTLGDMSLKYGIADRFSTDKIIDAAITENPQSKIYLKVHPDVLKGKKRSDINIENIKKRCIVIEEDVNPLALLAYMDKVYTKTSQMGFEALLLGKECICFGMPFYAGWGITDDRIQCNRRKRKLSVNEVFAAAYILYTQYTDGYSQKPSDILTAIKEMIYLKKVEKKKVDCVGYFFGFSRWKHAFIRPFFSEFKANNIVFMNPIFGENYLAYAIKKGLDKQSRIYIWGRKSFVEVEAYAKEHEIDLFRIEDGFIRSVGLGSDLTQPYSQVVDTSGIYFDPTQESDLEKILNHYAFAEDSLLMKRAKQISAYILEKKLSKYNTYDAKRLNFPVNKIIILVPGQVEDDASIQYGANGMGNIDLLKEVRKKRPLAHIIYKPHPDVLAGNRIGHIEKEEAFVYCDEIIEEVALDSILVHADEVHTMTSLVGFEAILRGITVYTYGMPFYAGWGLSRDMETCKRRNKSLLVDELVAGTLIVYPRYLHPVTKKLCSIESFLDGIDKERTSVLDSKYIQVKMKLRNILSRKVQWVLSYVV